MPRETFTAVILRDTYPERRVADHECLLAFDSEGDCAAFEEWLKGQGWEVFAVWLKQHQRSIPNVEDIT